ncbi:MAG: DUF3617 family protein [Betaproteobacteria bacterium]
MKKRFAITAACVLVCASVAQAESLAIKPGKWEMTYTSQVSGDSTPPALLEKMTPEQRARHAEQMKKRADAGPRQRTQTTCVKKEDLERDAFGKDRQTNCTYKITAQTRTLHAATYECTGKVARQGEFRYEVVSSDRVKGAMKITTAHSSMGMQLEGKWVGATCDKADD